MWYTSWYFAVIAIVAASFSLVRGFGQVICGLWLFSPANGEVKPKSTEFNSFKDNGIYFEGIKGVATLLLCFGLAVIITAYLVLKGIFTNSGSIFVPWLIEEAAFIIVLLIGMLEMNIEANALKILLSITLLLNILCFAVVITFYKGLATSTRHQESQKKVTFKDKPEINIISENLNPSPIVTKIPTDSYA